MKRRIYRMKVCIFAISLFSLLAAAEIPIRRFYSHGNYVHTFVQENKPTIQRVNLVSKENEKSDKTLIRKGILFTYPNAKANMVISHGFMCDKFDVGFLRNMFPKGQYNFLTFDFRAHGEVKDDQLCTFGKDESFDVSAAAHYFKQHPDLKHLPTIAYGFSMGAVATIEAQAKDSSLFQAMILDCPFDSTESIVKKSLQGLKVSLFGYEVDLPGRSYLERYAFHPYVQSFIKFMLKTVAHMDAQNIQTFMHRFSPAHSIKNINVPCFFIHCKNDQRVSVDAIKSIFNGAKGPKLLWVSNGRRHYDSIFYNPEKYQKRITTFFNQVLDGSISREPLYVVIEDKDEEGMRNLIHRGGA